ncbi:MAG: hypothetical protein NVSMB22_27640 [Chloroflexota bacterium]
MRHSRLVEIEHQQREGDGDDTVTQGKEAVDANFLWFSLLLSHQIVGDVVSISASVRPARARHIATRR